MPAAVKKPTVEETTAATLPAASTQAAVPNRPARPVVHPEITVNGVPIPREKLRLSAAFLRDLMGFETETEYRSRCEASDDPAVRAKGPAGFGEEFLPGSPELFGDKVRCWNNLDNRPFDPVTAEKYCQDAGDRRWAGFETMKDNAEVEMPLAAELGGGTVKVPTFTVNGETVIVGRTGKVESGQHRAVGGILLAHRWSQDPTRYPLWKEEPFIESLVTFGVSESPIVVRTLDNVRPRTTADTVCASEVFSLNPDGSPTGQKQRRDLSRWLDSAVDLLWKRTGAAFAGRFQTHAESHDFIDRHERIKEAVRFALDRGGSKDQWEQGTWISLGQLKLPQGQVAAAMYLMAAGRSDAARYAGDRSQDALDLTLWDKAKEFVAGLTAKNLDRSFRAVKDALGALKSLDDGLGGRSQEKLAVLAAAWHRFREGDEVRPQDLELAYGTDRNGNPCLLDPPTFGGVDLGHDPSPPERVTPAQAEAEKARVRAEKARQAVDALKDGPNEESKDKLAKLREDHPNAVLLFVNRTGDYNAFGEDAETLGRDFGHAVRKTPNGPVTVVHKDAFEPTVVELHGKGYNVKTVADRGGVASVTEVRKRPARPGGAGPAPVKPSGPAPARANGGGGAAVPKSQANGTLVKGKPAARKGPTLKGGIG